MNKDTLSQTHKKKQMKKTNMYQMHFNEADSFLSSFASNQAIVRDFGVCVTGVES